MRDAFGGVFMMRLMLAFIFIFVAFSAVSLNYAKAFKIKNQIIDVIEQMEVQDINDVSTYHGRIDSIIEAANYDESFCKSGPIEDSKGKVIGECHKGVTITIDNSRSSDEYIYYKVITHGGWNLNTLNMLLALGDEKSEGPIIGSWAVIGEAKVKNLSNSPNDSVVEVSTEEPDFDEKIEKDRCYQNKWVRVAMCQKTSVTNTKCILDDGTRVLRDDLRGDFGCKIPEVPFDDPQTGRRCSTKNNDIQPIYIDSCQNKDIRGAQCYIAGTGRTQTITRTYLTPSSNC